MSVVRACQFLSSLAVLVGSVVFLDENLGLDSGYLRLLANVLPVWLLYGLAFGLTRRPFAALIITIAFLGLIFSVNSSKLQHLGEALTFADVFLIEQVITGWSLLSKYVSMWGLAGLLAFLVFLLLALKFERPANWSICLLCLISGLFGYYWIALSNFAPSSLYSVRAHSARIWHLNKIANDQGLIASLITSTRIVRVILPEYDSEKIERAVQKHNLSLEEKSLVKPDIVVWLGESFFDPGIIDGVETCDYLPKYCDLKEVSLSSELDVPTFGGNTTRTEFEVLTGIPFSLLQTQSFPYMAVVHKKFNSIAWSLAAQGYEREVIHPHSKTFWQRDRALPLLGFQRFVERRDMVDKESDGVWISDQSLVRNIAKTLDAAGKPQFIFAISMEGHGPYDSRKVSRPEARSRIQSPEYFNTQAKEYWRQYIYHAQNSVRAIRALHSYVSQRKHPTLVVFFGDHLPGLKPVFDAVKFKNGEDRFSQKTPVLAFANYPLSSSWRPAASHELGLWTLDLAQQMSDDALSELVRATKLSKSPSGLDMKDVLKQFQIRQLYSLQ